MSYKCNNKFLYKESVKIYLQIINLIFKKVFKYFINSINFINFIIIRFSQKVSFFPSNFPKFPDIRINDLFIFFHNRILIAIILRRVLKK